MALNAKSVWKILVCKHPDIFPHSYHHPPPEGFILIKTINHASLQKQSILYIPYSILFFGVPTAICKIVVGRAEAQVARWFSRAVSTIATLLPNANDLLGQTLHSKSIFCKFIQKLIKRRCGWCGWCRLFYIYTYARIYVLESTSTTCTAQDSNNS